MDRESDTSGGGDRTSVLLELARELARARTRNEVADCLARAVPRVVGADRAFVLLWDPVGEALAFEALEGFTDAERELIGGRVFTPQEMPELDAIRTKLEPRHYRIDDAPEEIRSFMQAFDSIETYVVPVSIHDDFVGVIGANLRAGSKRQISDDDLHDRMAGLADQAALAFETARLMEQERDTVARLKAANAFKTEFVGVVSHELRTPLAAILGMARTLMVRGDSLTEETRQDFIATMVERGEQLERLVEDLLQSSRDIELRPEPIDLALLAISAVASANHLYPDRNVEYIGSERAPLIADGGRLRQVVDNLIINAIKYAPDSAVRVTAGRTGTEAFLRVEDDGPGMSTEQLDRVFQPFWQGPAASGPMAGGVGLGLYITRRIVEAHDGSISIDSTPDRGTEVLVTLPIEHI